MSFSVRVFLSFCLLVVSAAALDRNAFTFTHYEFELRANPDENAVAARGKVTLRNDSDQVQTHATIQISSSLDWRMVEIDGKQVEYLNDIQTSDIDHTGKLNEAVITLPNPVAPKGTVQIEFGYSGTITQDGDRLAKAGLPESAARAADWDRVAANFSGVRGIGHVTWYPIAGDTASIAKNTLANIVSKWQKREAEAEMKVRFCWVTDEERSYTVAANGRFDGISAASSELEGARTGCTAYTFQNLGETVPTFAMAPFEMVTKPLVSVYYLAGHEDRAIDFASAAEKVGPWIEEWFGKPKTKVQIIELPDANETPFDAGTMLFTPLNNQDKKFVEVAMAHQLTHAAFTSPRPWINEGLAQFSQALARERQDGRRAALDFMGTRLPVLAAAEQQHLNGDKASLDQSQSLVATNDEVYFRTKAMYVWWMLRDMLGDATLKTVLKNYRPAEDNDPTYVQRLISPLDKRDLQWFFDDWVYQDRGLADFKISSSVPRETVANQYIVAVTVENVGAAGAEVPVTVRMASGEKSSRMLIKAKSKEITRISVPGKPIEVVVNDGSVPESDPTDDVSKLPE